MKKLSLQILFFLNLLAVFGFWYAGSGNLLAEKTFDGIFIAIGRITGLLAEFFILFQLILIGRIHWIEKYFGHDKLVKYHRTNGFFVGSTIILHPLFLTIGYARITESSLLEQFKNFLTNWEHVLAAFAGLVIIILAIILSLPAVKKKLKYEQWHFTHLFIYVGIYLTFTHQTEMGDMSAGLALYYWLTLNYTVFGLLLLYRFVRPFYLYSKHRFKISRIEPESEGMFSFYIEGRNIDKFKFEAGQFANINFLKKGLWTSHPFSFSAAPNGKYLRFTIKALGDFTSQIGNLKSGAAVLIDGPLGAFTERSATKNKFLFVAGGIGITPIMSLIDSLTQKEKNDIILLYGNKFCNQIAFEKELKQLPIKQFCFISEPNEKVSGKNMQRGFIDAEKIKNCAPDFSERDIYFCGPPAMNAGLLKTFSELGIPPKQLHYEHFAF